MKNIYTSWRTAFLMLSPILLIMLLSMILAFFDVLSSSDALPVVKSPSGLIAGNIETFDGHVVDKFLGIPYAKPPIGNLRFAPPVPHGKVHSGFLAMKFSAECMQPKKWYSFLLSTYSEDCLYLNVFRKVDTKANDSKPVIAIIHGGGFASGSASEFSHTGIPLAATQDVVVVSMNYRLGVFGFADMKEIAPGNLGLMDQRLALEWIQENIRSFGGNPDNVTIMGVSAGSSSVNAQVITPWNTRGRPLFRRAIMDAGVVALGTAVTQAHSFQQLQGVSKKLSCPTEGTEMLECLRNIDAKSLNEAASDKKRSPLVTFSPTFDNNFLPGNLEQYLQKNSGNFADVEILIGFGRDEGTLFAGFQVGNLHVPDMNQEEFLAYAKKIAIAYNYPYNFDDPETQNWLIEDYFGKAGTFNDTAMYIRNSRYACPTNIFVKSFAQQHRGVYVYYFEHKLSVKVPFYDIGKLGVFHTSGFMHMNGAIWHLMKKYFVGLFLPEDDKKYFIDTMNLIGDFVRKNKGDVLRFRDLELPDFSQEGKLFDFNQNEPFIRDSLVFEEQCARLPIVYP